jgi:hypothetical protein
MPATKKSSVKKTITKKAVPTKAVAKKAVTTKTVTTKAAPKKAVAKKSVITKVVPKKISTIKASQKKPAAKQVAPKGERVEELVTQRNMDIKSVEEYMGIKDKTHENKPIIPGVFDLLIPPGTPRKIVLKMARDYNIDVVRRDDIYVPIGVCDIERDILAFRGDAKTVKKLEKILLKELDMFEKTGKVEGFKVIT